MDLSEPFKTCKVSALVSKVSLWRLFYESRECIAMTLFFKKNVQSLGYADDVDIIGRTKRDVAAAFSVIERESTKMSLAVNEGKAKYMLSTSGDVRHIDS